MHIKHILFNLLRSYTASSACNVSPWVLGDVEGNKATERKKNIENKNRTQQILHTCSCVSIASYGFRFPFPPVDYYAFFPNRWCSEKSMRNPYCGSARSHRELVRSTLSFGLVLVAGVLSLVAFSHCCGLYPNGKLANNNLPFNYFQSTRGIYSPLIRALYGWKQARTVCAVCVSRLPSFHLHFLFLPPCVCAHVVFEWVFSRQPQARSCSSNKRCWCWLHHIISIFPIVRKSYTTLAPFSMFAWKAPFPRQSHLALFCFIFFCLYLIAIFVFVPFCFCLWAAFP